MPITIYEPVSGRAKSAELIEQKLRDLYVSCVKQSGLFHRVVLEGLTVDFLHLGSIGVGFRVREGVATILEGRLDPGRPGKYAHGRLDITRWIRGRWEERFGVSVRSYDPHWDDEVSPTLKKMIRKAASQPPASNEAKAVVDLMISCADGRFEDLIELTITGDEYAGDHACWVVNAMRGPNMATVVPLMMWVNGAPSSDVLKAYKEAHDKQGVRRRHVRAVLGSSQRVADFLAFVTGADQLERVIEFVRAAPAIEVGTLLADLA